MVGSTSDCLTFIPAESRSEAAQEAIRVHVLRHRHRQHREAQARRIRGKDRSAVTQHGGQFQIWQMATPSEQSTSSSPNSNRQESLGTETGIDLSVQDEDFDFNSPSDAGPYAELETVTNTGSESDRRSIEEELIQHYVLSGGSPLAYDFLRTFRQSPATFSAFLAMAATRLSDEQGRNPLLDTTELENQAMHGVSQQISQSPAAPASSTILTVALLANLREGYLVHHWKALLEMVRLHGGLPGLRSHGDLYTFLIWAEGVAMDRCPESLGHLAPDHLQNSESQGSRRELRELLNNINARLSEQVNHAGAPTSKLTSPVLLSLQQPPVKKSRYVCTKWRRAKLACLLYFASLNLSTECRLQDHPQYRAVELEVLNRERNYTVYLEELYYITVQVNNDDHNCELSWSVARLVNAVKELDQRDRNTCYRLLALYLGFQDPHVAAMVSTEWEELSDRLLSIGIPGDPRDKNENPHSTQATVGEIPLRSIGPKI